MGRVFDTGAQRRAKKAAQQMEKSEVAIRFIRHPFSYVGIPKWDFVKFIAPSPGSLRDFVISADFILEDGIEININIITEDGGYHIVRNSKEIDSAEGIVVDTGDKVSLSFPGKDSLPEEDIWIAFNFYVQL
tara:strand:- start:122 stop:517 length:396 start_codon:yes stop_codon:yes gene_type:complete